MTITEDWLRDAGFKWHQLDRQPDRHWLLWIGEAAGDCHDSLGVEVTPVGRDDEWFCWLRSDFAGRYHRFIHVRHVKRTGELISLIEGLTGQTWDAANNLYGSMRKPKTAVRMRADSERLDRKFMVEGRKWSEIEKDDAMGGALPEHLEAYATTKKEKP
jgi:hypothetical protein